MISAAVVLVLVGCRDDETDVGESTEGDGDGDGTGDGDGDVEAPDAGVPGDGHGNDGGGGGEPGDPAREDLRRSPWTIGDGLAHVSRPLLGIVAVGLVVGLLGCNRGPVTHGEDDLPLDVPGETPDIPGDLPTDPTPDLPPTCEPPMQECPGDGCIDPRTDGENCGECDHRCYSEGEGVGAAGGCADGACLTTWFGCYPIETEYSCTEICGGPHGETCVENGCAGATIMWESVWVEDSGCSHDITDPSWLQQTSCDTPISEAFLAAGLPDFGPGTLWKATCCCTRS